MNEDSIKNNDVNQVNKRGILKKITKKSIVKIFLCILYTAVICIISVTTTLLIQYKKENSGAPKAIPPFKETAYAQKFDTFVAFSGGLFMPNCDTILKSNIIGEEDKKILSEFNAKCKFTESTSYFGLYNIYLGVKDGVDVIEIVYMGEPETLTFCSSFDYKLESIISEFEEMSGEKLTQDFLCGSKLDKRNFETQGISVGFKSLEDGTYGVYYFSIIKDKLYIIDK